MSGNTTRINVLAIEDDMILDLTMQNIVVCSYANVYGGITNGIDLSYKTQFPNLPEVEVVIFNDDPFL